MKFIQNMIFILTSTKFSGWLTSKPGAKVGSASFLIAINNHDKFFSSQISVPDSDFHENQEQYYISTIKMQNRICQMMTT